MGKLKIAYDVNESLSRVRITLCIEQACMFRVCITYDGEENIMYSVPQHSSTTT